MIERPPIQAGKRRFGPCGQCAFYDAGGTPEAHTTGRCHGAPPSALGWVVVHELEIGCAVFQPKDKTPAAAEPKQ